MFNPATSRRPEMLGAFPGFRRTEPADFEESESLEDDDNNTLTSSQVYINTPTSERSNTVAASAGSAVEEQPLEESENDNKDNEGKGCCGRRRSWFCCLGIFVILALVFFLVAWFFLLADGNDTSPDTSKSSNSGSGSSGTPVPCSTMPPSLVPMSSVLETVEPTLFVDATATTEPSLNDASTTKQPTLFLTTEIPMIATSHPSTVPPTSHDMPSDAPSSENFANTVKQIKDLLNLTVPLDDKESPQYKTAEWLAEKDQVLPKVMPSLSEFMYTRRLAQRYTLALLYFSTGGKEQWTDQCSFLNETLHECEWKCRDSSVTWDPKDRALLDSKGITDQGVYCYEFDGFRDEIEHLILADLGLSGPLPPDLSQLIAVRTLWLCNNRLTGTIPDTLVSNHFLEEVRLESNALTGPALPWARLSEISFLRDWRAANNNLSGQLQVQWHMAQQLEVLDLGYNDLTGMLPHGFWSLPWLRHVVLAFNDLHGSLPDSLGSHLEKVDLQKNQLSGALPIDLDEAQGLFMMNVKDNQFTGNVPQTWASLDDLEMLDVSGNPGLDGSLEIFCSTPRAGRAIYATCSVLACSCCLCV